MQWKTTPIRPDVRTQDRPKGLPRATETPLAKVSAPCPPAAPHVANFGDNEPVETPVNPTRVDRDVDDPGIKAETDRLTRPLAQFNLAESARQQRKRELAYASGPRERLAVLARWLEHVECACEATAALVARYQASAVERDRPGPRLTIAPWLRGR